MGVGVRHGAYTYSRDMFKVNIPNIDIDLSSIKSELTKGGEALKNKAKSNVHVISGELRNSIQMRIEETSDGYMLNVGTDLFYAPFEEYGTGGRVFVVNNGSGYTFTAEDKQGARQFYVSGKGHNFAHPFLLPAYFEHRNKIVEQIKKAIKWR